MASFATHTIVPAAEHAAFTGIGELNLRWNNELRRFEAELGSGGFKADLEAVKAAGFKCDGPPSWVWSTESTLHLKWLREHRPPVLTIEADARMQYESRLALDEANAKVKAAAASEKKERRKARVKEERQEALVVMRPMYFDQELGCMLETPPDPCTAPAPTTPFVRPAPPEEKCFVCNSPVYAYEYLPGEPPACLWCQKNVLDKDGEVC